MSNPTKPTVSAIAAIQEKDRGIGKNNDLMWNIPGDLKHFRRLTSGHPVIMGRKTWESIPEKFRPLPRRTNIILTRNTQYKTKGATVTHSLDEAIGIAKQKNDKEIFIIGGESIYKAALPFVDRLYLTLVKGDFEADTFFPEYENEFELTEESKVKKEENLEYTFCTFERKND